MQLFYNPEIKKDDITFVFDKEESKHIIKVLRKKEGDAEITTKYINTDFEFECFQ